MLSLAILLVAAINNAAAQSNNVTIKGVKGTRGSINTMGGDITIYRDLTKEGGNKTEKTADITVSFLRLTELNKDKMPVIDKNNKSHTMTTFSKQTFTCISSPNFTMPYSSSVKADCWSCSTDFVDLFGQTITAPAKFRIMACIVQNNGTITQQQEVSNVTEGQLKLSIEVTKGWPWCEDATCVNGRGQFLDLDLAIKLPASIKRADKVNRTKVDYEPARFDLGGGIKVEFSAMSLVDGAWAKLGDTTPSLTQNSPINQTDTVALRFNRFENNLLYDPTFDLGNSPFDQNSSGRLAAVSLPLLLLIAMATPFMTSLQ